jgi:hypothetical protein
MADLKEFEIALIKILTNGQIDKSILKSISGAIVNLKKQGLVIDHVHIKGQPRPERIIINGIVDPEFWNKFKDLGSNFRRFEVFPYGIVNPEGFRFNAIMPVL